MTRTNIAACAAVALVAACSAFAPTTQRASDVLVLDQGWDQMQRDLFYYTSQGTFLMPAAWLDSLELANGRRFMARENLEKFGLIYDDVPSGANPYSWPIGFAIDNDPRNGGIAQAGLTCAACHTAQVEYRGHRIRIDGGQSNIDFRPFDTSLSEAIVATGSDPESRSRFLKRAKALGYPADRLEADFEAIYRGAVDQAEHPRAALAGMTPAGRGRFDAITSIANAVFSQSLAVPENTRRSTAPTNYPHLWDIWRFDWVQYNASVRQPMGRNITEALGTGPIRIADPVTGKVLPEPERWKSNIPVRNLYAIETTLHSLTPPPWPEAVLGTIDREKAAAGRELFTTNCSSCHGIKQISGTSNPVEWHVPVIPLLKVGTDANQAVNFARFTFDATKIGGPVNMGIPEGLFAVVVRVKRQAYLDAGIPEEEWPLYNGFGRPDEDGPAPCGYKARPLVGVWATGPFLHNGSVPTIFDLLSEKRPSRFLLGSGEFDPVRLGQAQRKGTGVIEVDTSLPGNGNDGHWFTDDQKRPGRIGRGLSDDERYAIIEYLKAASYSDYPTAKIAPPGPAACSEDRNWAKDWPSHSG